MCFLLMNHVNARVLCLQVDGGNTIDFYINVVALSVGLNSLLLHPSSSIGLGGMQRIKLAKCFHFDCFIDMLRQVILLSWFCYIPLFNFLTKNGPLTTSHLDIAKPLFNVHMTHEMTGT
ncbi:hypothetical protein RHGRI_013919 [Rhododendron griersonianum]|uniref:Uncharacterized protein n=1 Tax=Rhododendron griersonianum TaxID=479676 RepID=A0AAV6K7D6_9ERIC|nr:hypothetical protein RHGRI_013919 [Rhododendron griersonianum]